MSFKRNVPGWERILRLAGGIGLLIASATVPMPVHTTWILAVSGVALVLMGLAGWCPACAMVGRRPVE